MEPTNPFPSWRIFHLPALSLIRGVVFFSIAVLLLSIVLAVALSLSQTAIKPLAPDESVLQGVAYKPVIGSAENLVIAERPLFWSSRTPYEPEVEPESVPEPEPVVKNKALNDVVLLGVILTSDVARVVIEDKKEKVSLRRGESYKGWELEQVAADGVEFVRADTVGGDSPVVWEVLLRQRKPLPSEWPGTSHLQQPQNN